MDQATQPIEELFSVYWYDPTGQQYRERYLQPIESCKEVFDQLTQGPAAILGLVKSIRVTDGLDRLVVELTKQKDQWVRTPIEGDQL
jgi:hypothetical protein|tara:strand:+ start:2409 stop:2669 length:261 start_codon:yes stop_codon:yes gene_type:complete